MSGNEVCQSPVATHVPGSFRPFGKWLKIVRTKGLYSAPKTAYIVVIDQGIETDLDSILADHSYSSASI